MLRLNLYVFRDRFEGGHEGELVLLLDAVLVATNSAC